MGGPRSGRQHTRTVLQAQARPWWTPPPGQLTFSDFSFFLFPNSGQLKSQTPAVDMGSPLPHLSHARLLAADLRCGFGLRRMLHGKATKVVSCMSFVCKHRGLCICSAGCCFMSDRFSPPRGGHVTRHCVRKKPFLPAAKCRPCPSARLRFPSHPFRARAQGGVPREWVSNHVWEVRLRASIPGPARGPAAMASPGSWGGGRTRGAGARPAESDRGGAGPCASMRPLGRADVGCSLRVPERAAGPCHRGDRRWRSCLGGCR